MQSRVDNVLSLRAPGKSLDDLPMSVERLRMAVQELDILRRYVERAACEPHWSALEWRAACTPLMLRLPGVRLALAGLVDITPGQWPDTSWAVKLRAARDEMERRLADVTTSLSALAHGKPITVGAMISFGVEGIGLVKAADELSSLIADRYPEAVGAS